MSDKDSKNKKQKGYDWALIVRIFGLARPYKGFVIGAVILTLASAVLTPVRTKLIQLALDNHVAKGDYEGLINISLLLVGLLIINTFVNFGQSYITALLGQSFIT